MILEVELTQNIDIKNDGLIIIPNNPASRPSTPIRLKVHILISNFTHISNYTFISQIHSQQSHLLTYIENQHNFVNRPFFQDHVSTRTKQSRPNEA